MGDVHAAALTLVTLMAGLKPSLPPETDPRAPQLPPPTLRPPEDDRPLRLTFGGGAAFRSVEGPAEAAFPLELTLTMPPFSLSTGVVFSTVDGLAHAYGEIGLYLGLSVGAGLGYGAHESAQGRHATPTTHLFFGFPIPIAADAFKAALDAEWFPYIVPYYRPSWGPWSGAAHEGGVMLKFSYQLIAGRWQIN